jgi:hypothetical protein
LVCLVSVLALAIDLARRRGLHVGDVAELVASRVREAA